MADAARESIRVFHSNAQGVLDYSITLTCTYGLEEGQWVGVCTELGTAAFADTPDEARAQLQEAVQLQLNEVERLTDVRDYLEENEVPIAPLNHAETTGFAVAAGSRLEYIGS
jgi:predicted RNase H-like HicB family nuclease